ncbi:hypothetical protein WJ74_17890 [Burkholderia ubonensis]|nr:hypothetical protein WJ74_17890 [Burkholderia ubonensis]
MKEKPGNNLDFTRPDTFESSDAEAAFYTDKKQSNETKIDDYWNEPLTINGVTETRKFHVTEADKNMLAKRAEQGIQDGELSPQARTQINRLRTYPSASEREGQSGMSGVYSIAGNTSSDETKVDFSGMYVITERPAEGDELRPDSDVGKVMLVIPGQPIKQYESMQDLDKALKTQLDSPTERDRLLQYTDADKRTGLSNGGVDLSYKPIKGNVFEDRLESQIKQQKNDAAYLSKQMSEGSITPEEAAQSGETVADSVRSNNDMKPYLVERAERKQDEKNLELLKEALPDWLKERPVGDNEVSAYDSEARQSEWEKERENYLDLAKKAAEKQIEASDATSDIKTLDEFTKEKAKAYLAENGYSDADVNDFKVQVTSITSKTTPSQSKYPHGTSQSTTASSETMSLTSYLQRNNQPLNPGTKTYVQARRYDSDVGGDRPVDLDVEKMSNELNIGKTYPDYLKEQFISPADPTRREKLQEADRAIFERDISQAKLQGTIGKTQDKRGPKWAESVLNHPDPASRPKVDGYTIEANRLSINGEPVSNVYVIGPKEKDSNKSVVLYTPGAPDGKNLREFSDRKELAEALKSPELRDYLLQRVDPGAKGAVSGALTSLGGVSFSETPIEGNFFDAMYVDRVNRTIVNADRATTSNAERGKQSAWNIYNFGLDKVTVLPGINIPVSLGHAGVSFFNAAEAFQRGDSKAALNYLFEGVDRLGNIDSSNAPAPRKGGGIVPSIKKQSGANGVSTYAVEPNDSGRIPSSFAVAKPSDVGEPERGIYSATRDGKKYEYVKIDDQFYNSGQNGQGRYIQDPANPTNRIPLERVGDKWQMAASPLGKKTERPTLNGLNDWLNSSEEFNKDSLRKNSSMIHDVFSEEKNSEPFNRLLDIQVQKNIISRGEREAILSEPDPGARAAKYLGILSARSEDQISQFPGDLKKAVENGDVAKNAKKYISDMDDKSKQDLIDFSERLPGEGQFGKDALTKNWENIGKLFGTDANKDEFKRLLDIQVQKNIISRGEREAILSEPDPGARAAKYLGILSARSEDQISQFPGDLKQAVENGDVAKNAKKYISDMDDKSKQDLIDFSERLPGEGRFGKDALTKNWENIGKLFGTDANKDEFKRLLDIQVQKNIISRGEREAILSEPDPGARAAKYLGILSARSEDQISQFPGQLTQAIGNG